MASGIDIEDGFTDGGRAFLTKVGGDMGIEVARIAKQVVGMAQQYAPVDTGTLQRSIRVMSAGQDGRGPFADIGTDVNYGIYQELGTYKMDAHPWLRPAMLATGLHPEGGE